MPDKSRYSVIFHQLTSPRTAQFVLVTVFSLVVVVNVYLGKDIPDIIGFVLSAIIGYYFGDKGNDSLYPNGHSVDKQSAYIDQVYYQTRRPDLMRSSSDDDVDTTL